MSDTASKLAAGKPSNAPSEEVFFHPLGFISLNIDKVMLHKMDYP